MYVLFRRQNSQTLSQEDTREHFPLMLPLGLALEEEDVAFTPAPAKPAERMCDVDEYLSQFRKSHSQFPPQNQFPPAVSKPEQIICDVDEWLHIRHGPPPQVRVPCSCTYARPV